MSEPDLSLSQLKRLNQICDAFESEWQAGRKPEIQAYLERVDPELRSHLFRDLLRLEIELRRAAGEQIFIEEYRQRFPEGGDIVAAVIRAEPPNTIDSGGPVAEEQTESPPTQLGRYDIVRVLGKGGFGVVYLAHDPKLDRPVAIKVPRRERFQTAEEVERFVQEARTAAKLKHDLLVAVYDVQEHDGLPFIVQEYVEGQNLGEWATKNQPSFEQIARVLVAVSEALGYAHQQGLTHCDLKLANVLMDTAGQPHVADFGLAVHESAQALRKGEVFGTPAMMAPEQVRGETHRLDGRTDVWAIGVMLYELLAGRRPFTADSRKHLFAEIQAHDPKPPRQIDRSVPRELERICLKCLSKRRTHRYNTTDDLREDLLAWLGEEPSTQVPQSTAVVQKPDSSSGSKPPVKIIPKGLRSFDAEDADFFLVLLPGPRDRDGLPESIRFWKHRIEEIDPDQTFAVGLIYGPSGCGKSSLVKAGLLPRLSEQVLPVYVEATAADTEVRILKQLRKHIPRLPSDISLPDACAELRLTGAGRDRKILLVIDQFEQWLHAQTELKNTQLVDALRHCDGGRLQAVLLVRDDFYSSVNRLFQELEERLVEGHNYALVDRFDKDHAGKVLMAFGRAYGKLEDNLSPEQEQFVAQAIDELAEDNKVISVRLSLFADMLKTRLWVPAGLKDVGGVGGVGVTFLEETFSVKTAPPSHRVHQQAIRGVLKALLPEAGTDIRGSMKSAGQLRDASGYQESGRQFDELIHILDNELRLITPTDTEGTDSAGDSKYYQLTHDYLVPSLREWLTRKQRETRRGRAELKLAERSALWTAKPENRHLPSVVECVGIRLLTNRATWTQSQQQMMRQATKFYGLWGTVTAAVMIAVIAALWVIQRSNAHERLVTVVNTLETCNPLLVPGVLQDLEEFSKTAVREELEDRFSSPDVSDSDKLRLAVGLARYNNVEAGYLVSRISAVTNLECVNIIDALREAKSESLAAVREAASQAAALQGWKTRARLAIVAVYLGDTSIADDMLEIENRPDPIQRTMLIAEIPEWHGDLRELADLVGTSDKGPTRSGFALGVGSISATDAGDLDKEFWQDTLALWFGKPDSATHSASGWAMREWGLQLPEVQTPKPVDQRSWWHTRLELTMLRIPKGRLPGQEEPIESFWLSDREIWIALFQQFMDDDDPANQRPDPNDWQGAHMFGGKIDDSHPMQTVSWEDAVMFCNWLSRRHDLGECYEIEELDKPPEEGSRGRAKYNVTPLSDVDGFRLPTEKEWEYACRASTTTDFSCGDDEGQLRDYAVFSASRTMPCGSLLCNAWGLFDMHGNVWEWCEG